jgi:hypothetical protein
MKIETITYWAAKIVDIRNRLPDFVKEAIIMKAPYHRQRDLIEIDAQNRKAIEYLDNEFRELIASGQCLRRYDIYIDEKEITNYPYFYILPEHLEYHKYVFADVRMPTCIKKTLVFGTYQDIIDCNIGGQLLSPVKVKRKKTEKLDIATLNYPWEKEVVLLLSARIKKIFESEGITGLVYEPAQFISAAHRIDYVRADGISHMVYKEVPDDSPETLENPYIARISHNIHVEADRIFFKKYRCEIHLSIDRARYENPRIPKKEIRNMDFFQVEGVRVKGKTYPYQNNYFSVSRKVLEILLKNDAKGLHRVGSIIKSKFAPLTEISD